jgi:hypothetical protein
VGCARQMQHPARARVFVLYDFILRGQSIAQGKS